jgi:hypothetical protein
MATRDDLAEAPVFVPHVMAVNEPQHAGILT